MTRKPTNKLPLIIGSIATLLSFTFLLSLLSPPSGLTYAQGTKVSAMTADTSPTSDDITYTVNDPAGTPASRKVTLSNLTKGLAAADASTQGVVTTGTQTFAGVKTFPGLFTVVETVSTSPRGILSSQYSTDTSGARVGFAKARGTQASPTTIVSGDTLGRLMFRGYDGSNFLEMASIEAVSTGTIAATRVPTYMTFSTATDAAPSVLAERMRIASDGLATIGSGVMPGVSFLGTWTSGGTFAALSHSNFRVTNAGTKFALIQDENGTTYLNSAGGLDLNLALGGTRMVVLTTGGVLGVNNTGPTAQLHITDGSASRVGLAVDLAASQSANAINVTSSGGAAGDLFKVASNGDTTVPDEAYDATAWNAVLEVPTKNAVRDKIESLPTLASGTYTPTLTNQTNVAASTTYAANYMRVGGVVTVSGKVDVDPTAAGQTQLGISLPIASAVSAEEKVAGSSAARGIAGQSAAVLGDVANDRATMEWVTVDFSNQSMFFEFTYTIE
jgi:hypothetical protein